MIALLAGAAALATAPPASADGDPASDVLATQPLFLPRDAGVSSTQQRQLVALLGATRKSGLALRVAVIASSTDLGSVGALWHRPSQYAAFLGQELSLVFRGPLLVVMPNGFALYGAGSRAPSVQSTVAALPSPDRVSQIGEATLTAVQRIAAASGHAVALPQAIVASAPSRASSDALAWLVFAAGAATILAAWALSLRARPLKTRPTSHAP